jgi:hypothetical protein
MAGGSGEEGDYSSIFRRKPSPASLRDPVASRERPVAQLRKRTSSSLIVFESGTV